MSQEGGKLIRPGSIDNYVTGADECGQRTCGTKYDA